jgi:glycosyltransferase involved in cell wall biosynthesis
LRPRVFVELGTHGGYSYFVFCQAVQRLRLSTRCFAVDTWNGDEQIGFYGEEVYQQVCARNDRLYSGFSNLIRSTFEEAAVHFSDETVDLLHIDGRHLYNDVKKDFERWRAKLSSRSVVLFHGTRGFGVFKLWEELRASHPTFEFLHGSGLGVLGFGRDLPHAVERFLELSSNAESSSHIREAYSRIGSAISLEFAKEQLTTRITRLANETHVSKARGDELESEVTRLKADLSLTKSQLALRTTELLEEHARRTELNELAEVQLQRVRSMEASTSWRVTEPLRLIATAYPPFFNLLTHAAKLVWWCVTLRMGHLRTLWRRRKDVRLIASSVLFDEAWYRKQNPDVRGSAEELATHYLLLGGMEGRDPSLLFDSDWYLAQYPDVGLCGCNPLLHYLRYGLEEGRDPRELLTRPGAESTLIGNENWLAALVPSDTKEGIKTIAVSHNLNQEGAPNSQLELLVGLQRRGSIEPIVLSSSDGPLRSAYQLAGIQTELVVPLDLSSVTTFEESAKVMANAFRESGAELVYANTLQTFWGIAVAERAGVPAIWNVRESEDWKSYFDYLPPDVRSVAYKAFDYPHRIVFVSDAGRQGWEPVKSRENFVTIRNALNPARLQWRMGFHDRGTARAKLRVSDTDVAFVLLGTVCERKGQLDLVRAFELLPEALASQTRVVIVGDRRSVYSEQLHQAANALPPDRAERFVIVPETGEPYLYFHAADVALCCSRIESYPRVVLEAMAFGLPIITTPVFGIAEQVQNGVNALFYEPGDAAALAAHMSRLITDNYMRLRMASSSRAVFSSLPSYDDMLDAYSRIIVEAAASTDSKRMQDKS